MKQHFVGCLAALALLGFTTHRAAAHCQIPCGIYNDPVRFTLLEEHLTTIEKSMKEIIHLGTEHDRPDYNQLARWVQNKEDHVTQFTEIVTYYFMAQRIKPADANDKAATEKYVKEITLLHKMVVSGMKAKQTTDLKNIEDLRGFVSQFKQSYLGTK